MATFNPNEPKEAATKYLSLMGDDVKRTVMSRHLAVLRGYAKTSVMGEGFLTAEEEADRAVRMREFQIIGQTFELSEKEMVSLIYNGIFGAGDDCTCRQCSDSNEGQF